MSSSLGSDKACLNNLEDLPAKLDVETIEKSQPTSNTYGPTDGGWDAWVTVLGATLIALSTFG
jgi:hypothetical protein